MAALDVDGSQSDYLQQGSGGVDQDAPSPLALLAATCSKIGSPLTEEDNGVGVTAAWKLQPGHCEEMTVLS
ncbi:hypothetical protein SKAU_G00235380 [Synaphobranchus kaupii]|uniref:Uncharacterized protein n=1 Tax=Synaphobranchus kaupii TaxID=118154 RepID=A0A9Q1ITD2_SYNKA|nr:hypothetical protein SKAU_G00235380 [Synaphobranchus kaupii]